MKHKGIVQQASSGPSCVALLVVCVWAGMLCSWATASVACAPGCTAHGNCNPDDGSCQCRFGWTGAACEVLLFPACMTHADGKLRVGRFAPKNCACFNQTFTFFGCGMHDKNPECQRNTFRDEIVQTVHSTCYTYTNVSYEQQRSVLPAPGQPGVTWHKFRGPGRPLEPLPPEYQLMYLDPWKPKGMQMLPLSACRNNCTDSGICLRVNASTAASCHCDKGIFHLSSDCSAPDLTLCPNQCQGRGTCIAGFCHCTPPWFGADCGRNESVTWNKSARPPHHKLSIYVYELPHSVSAPIALDDIYHDRSPTYMAYEAFNAALLSDSSVRTLDPYTANLFYIPAHVYSYSSNIGDPSPHVAHVIKYIREKWPFYNRTGGVDHAFWLPGDKGSCYLRREFQHMVHLVHFGYHVSTMGRPNVSTITPAPVNPLYGCFNPVKDVVAPPLFHVTPAELTQLYKEVQDFGGKDIRRDLLMFFVGSVRLHQPTYSGGARQKVFHMLNARKAAGDNLTDVYFHQGRVNNYHQLHRRAKFCLCPHGSGFGMRLMIAVAHACIPVITSDLVVQPLEPLIPYHEFSIRIPHSQLDSLLDVLRSMSLEEQARLRLGMLKWHRALLWDTRVGGYAYNMTLQALFRSVTNRWGNLY